MKHRFARRALAAVAGALLASGAHAQTDDINALRDELRRLRESYEQRIQALERRLQQAESPAPAAAAPAPPPATPAPAAVSGFNPEVSLILQGALARQSRDADEYRLQGFMKPRDAEGYGPPERRGFSLQETELVMSANADRHFRGYLNLALDPENEVEVEEAYVQTLGLGGGLTVKGGRFLSGIGYQNELHPHAWDFADAPLVYTAFFAGRLASEGLQVKWVAPTQTYLELGVEGGRDDGFPGSGRNKRGFGLGSLFARIGGDVGESHSWRAGLSLLRTSARERAFDETDAGGVATVGTFSGASRTAGLDFVWKWAPGGNPRATNLKLQGEWFRRRESGTLACADADAASLGACGGGLSDGYSSRQWGAYAQAVWQFMTAWRVGYRHDRLDSGSPRIGLVDSGALIPADFASLQPHRPRRDTAMLDWAPSEFSRVRLQFAYDRARLGAADRQLWLQYVMSLGAHGAHRF